VFSRRGTSHPKTEHRQRARGAFAVFGPDVFLDCCGQRGDAAEHERGANLLAGGGRPRQLVVEVPLVVVVP
jgi:hypothetical protein